MVRFFVVFTNGTNMEGITFVHHWRNLKLHQYLTVKGHSLSEKKIYVPFENKMKLELYRGVNILHVGKSLNSC